MRAASPLRRSAIVACRASGGLPAARRFKKRLTRGSRGISARINLQSQCFSCRRRPLLEVQAVIREQCDCEPIDSKGDAAGMCQLALLVADPPHLSEMLAVVVEAHARGRRCARIIRN